MTAYPSNLPTMLRGTVAVARLNCHQALPLRYARSLTSRGFSRHCDNQQSALIRSAASGRPPRPSIGKSLPQQISGIRPYATSSQDWPAPSFDGSNVLLAAPASGRQVAIPNVFLRDHCQCSECVHEVTKQRLFETVDLPADLTIQDCELNSSNFSVKWSDGHSSLYKYDWLRHVSARHGSTSHQHTASNIKLWDSTIAKNPPVASYADIMSSSAGVASWTSLIRTHGFSFIDGCPPTPEDTQTLLERIAFIRPTHYGAFWDFTSDLSSGDTAYTSLALPAHTDTTYFTDPCGLQMFHLLSHASGDGNEAATSSADLGGASLLVDGFAAARDLRARDPDAFDILASTPVYCHASGNDDTSIQPADPAPVFTLCEATGELTHIRWNESDRAAISIPLSEPQRIQAWYGAARSWSRTLREARFEYWSQLRPGRPVIFDNWRVLHGRSGFRGKRRLCGGYVNRDDWISRWRMTNLGRKRVLQNLGLENS